MKTGAVTPKEVRDLLRIGLKSEAELHPDFPATGELPVPVLADSDRGGENPQDDQIETSGHEARESTTTAGPTLPAQKEPDSRGGQAPLCNLSHVFDVVEQSFYGDRK